MQRTIRIIQPYKPNSVSREKIEVAIIYLTQMLPPGSSGLPGDYRSEQPRFPMILGNNLPI